LYTVPRPRQIPVFIRVGRDACGSPTSKLLSPPAGIQERTYSTQNAPVVRVDTDADITGWGEVDGCPAVVQAIVGAPASHTLATGLKRVLVGEDPLEIRRLWEKVHARTLHHGRAGAVIQAMAGIDLALWGIKQGAGVPVSNLLGCKFHERPRVYSSNTAVAACGPERTAARSGPDRRGRPGA
jgi:L-rhamnonate dehydratase